MSFNLLKRIGNKSLFNNHKRFATTIQQKYDQCIFNGANSVPSVVMQSSRIDTTIWQDVPISDSDIFISTPAKAGTTWTQEIVAQLLYNGDYVNKTGIKSGFALSHWVTMNFLPREATIQVMADQLNDPNITRRLIKTHEPVECLPFNPQCKYIAVGRDYRDIIWSIYNFYSLFSDAVYELANNAQRDYKFQPLYKPNFEDGSFTEHDLWNKMLTLPDDHNNPDGWCWWSQLWTIASWLKIRHLPNVKIIHYNNLKEDLSGSMRDIANFLDLEIDETNFNNLVNNCSFGTMKANEDTFGEAGFMFKDPKEFFYKGTNNRWKDVLTDQDTDNYRQLAKRYLTDDEIYWLENGKFPQ